MEFRAHDTYMDKSSDMRTGKSEGDCSCMPLPQLSRQARRRFLRHFVVSVAPRLGSWESMVEHSDQRPLQSSVMSIRRVVSQVTEGSVVLQSENPIPKIPPIVAKVELKPTIKPGSDSKRFSTSGTRLATGSVTS